jgi:hypothetical protein
MKTTLIPSVLISLALVFALSCSKTTQSSQSDKSQDASQSKKSDTPLIKTYGGSGIEIAKDMVRSEDGGFVLAGSTTSKGNGESDGYLVRIDSRGNMIWDAAFGGKNNEAFYGIAKASDHGYVACGKIETGTDKSRDLYIVKVDDAGKLVWEKNYGDAKEEEGNCIIPTSDKGYIIAGLTNSKGKGSGDAWIVKISQNGSIEWDRTFGSKSPDFANSITRTKDGGYAVAGFGGEKNDIFVAKLDSKGNAIWEKFIGTANYETANSIIETEDGSLVLSGMQQQKPNVMLVDALIVKLSPKGDVIWQKAVKSIESSNTRKSNDAVTANELAYGSAMSIKQTQDKGFITCGTFSEQTKENGAGDLYFIKLKPNGDVEWKKTIGGPDVEYGNVIITEPGGTYAFAGYIGYRDKAKQGNFDMLFGRL